MKLGIIVDSSCGLESEEAHKKEWMFLPLYMTIDGVEYKDGVNISKEKYYKEIKFENVVQTSATPPGIASEIFEEASKKFDLVIVYPLSTELSSQRSNLANWAKEFPNIHVVNSRSVGNAICNDLEEIIKYANESKTKEEVIKYSDSFEHKLFGVVVPLTLDWLVKGGRVSPGVAALAKVAKISPWVSLKDGKLEKFGKGRVFRKSLIKAFDKAINESGEVKEFILYNANNPEIQEIKKEVEEKFKIKITLFSLPPVITNHTGPGAIALVMRLK